MALTNAEHFAVANILTEWPADMTYDELLTAVENQHEDVIVWEAFENEHPTNLPQLIDDMRVQFLGAVNCMTYNLRNAIKEGDPMTIAERLASLENQLGV